MFGAGISGTAILRGQGTQLRSLQARRREAGGELPENLLSVDEATGLGLHMETGPWSAICVQYTLSTKHDMFSKYSSGNMKAVRPIGISCLCIDASLTSIFAARVG